MNRSEPYDGNNYAFSAQRLILSNLILLFILAIAIIVAIVQRQQFTLRQRADMDQFHALYGSGIELNRSPHALRQFFFTPDRDEPSTMQTLDNSYANLQQRAVAQINTFRTAHAASANQNASIDAHIERYAAIWELVDNQVQSNSDGSVEIQPRALASYLLEMDTIVKELLLLIHQAAYQKEQTNVAKAQLLDNILFTLTLFFFVLTLVTIHRFWHFAQKHQNTALALQTEERYHRTLLEAIPDMVLRRTRAGLYTYYKPARTFGPPIPTAELVGKHISDILPPDIADSSLAVAEQALELGQELCHEYRMPNLKTGVLTDYEARVMPTGADEVQVLIRDVTEEKVRAERLQQAQKLESLGLLAGGVAHDFNNLLTGMMAQITLAQARRARGESPDPQLDRARIITERAADLTHQLLAYAGKGKFQMLVFSLNQLIEDNLGLLETALPTGARLQLELTESLPLIEADRGHMQQIIMNIAINAADALHKQETQSKIQHVVASPAAEINSNRCEHLVGTETIPSTQDAARAADNHRYLKITTSAKQMTIDDISAFTKQMPEADAMQPGLYVLLRIEDSGIGMNESTLKRIFDPFFSTKQNGHGLGLAATLGIVRSYGGSIQVESEPGVGSSFEILLPATQQSAMSPTTIATQTSPSKHALNHILVIDDEAAIREVVREILTSEGYAVLDAANGEAGVAQLREQKETIDLVLLDMKMPGLDGMETLDILHSIKPTLRVIFSSGYTETDIDDNMQSKNVVGFLAKPYNIDQLLQTVYHALAAPEPS